MNLPARSSADCLPRPRRAGPLSRPHHRNGPGRWRWHDRSNASPVLAPGDPFFDEARHLARRTPTGLTETELLASFNYLDAEALQAFEGIGPTLAANIVSHRSSAQYFASLDELALVPRIGARRFAKLAGRPPETARFRLHDLMRRSRREDIRLADLQPWPSPAQGIATITVRLASEPAPLPAVGQTFIVLRLRRHAIHFLCTAPISGGRSAFLHKNLPEVLRPILS